MATKKWLGGAVGSTGDLAVASNYAPSGVPTNGDDLYFEANPSGTDYSVTTNLSTFQNTTLNSINVGQTYSGQIGVANTGTSSTTTGYMSLGGTNSTAITVNIGYQFGGTSAGNGSSLIRLNVGSSSAMINITNTAASSAMANAGPVTILGANTGNTMNIQAGTATVAIDATEASIFATINNKGNLTLGGSVTLTMVNHNGGNITIRSGVVTINQTLGNSNIVGSGTVGTFNLYGGGSILNTTGTITNLNIYSATADMSRNQAARTVTTVTGYAGATLNLNNGVKNSITITNPINTNGAMNIVGWFGSKYALS